MFLENGHEKLQMTPQNPNKIIDNLYIFHFFNIHYFFTLDQTGVLFYSPGVQLLTELPKQADQHLPTLLLYFRLFISTPPRNEPEQ